MDNDSKVEIGDHKQSHKRDLTVHGIPYSEHSSFPELVECIDCLKPKRIIPTVSVSTSEQQVALLLNALKRKGLEGTGTC